MTINDLKDSVMKIIRMNVVTDGLEKSYNCLITEVTDNPFEDNYVVKLFCMDNMRWLSHVVDYEASASYKSGRMKVSFDKNAYDFVRIKEAVPTIELKENVILRKIFIMKKSYKITETPVRINSNNYGDVIGIDENKELVSARIKLTNYRYFMGQQDYALVIAYFLNFES